MPRYSVSFLSPTLRQWSTTSAKGTAASPFGLVNAPSTHPSSASLCFETAPTSCSLSLKYGGRYTCLTLHACLRLLWIVLVADSSTRRHPAMEISLGRLYCYFSTTHSKVHRGPLAGDAWKGKAGEILIKQDIAKILTRKKMYPLLLTVGLHVPNASVVSDNESATALSVMKRCGTPEPASRARTNAQLQ